MFAAVLGVICAGCGAGAPSASPAACAASGLRAVERHVTVTALPGSCAGLTRTQVNEAVARAIREAVGPLPRAAARSLAIRDSRFLAGLVRAIRPPAPQSPAAAQATPAEGLQLRLSALGCSALTALAGSYLLARTGLARRRRRGQPPGTSRAIVAGHAVVAGAGVVTCAACAFAGTRALAWAAVALIVTAAGLGMATLVTALPDPAAVPRKAGPPPGSRQSLVAVVALHGLLATVTILVVVLAAISSA